MEVYIFCTLLYSEDTFPNAWVTFPKLSELKYKSCMTALAQNALINSICNKLHELCSHFDTSTAKLDQMLLFILSSC